MKNTAIQLGALLLSAVFLMPASAAADESYAIQEAYGDPSAERFTNANWNTLSHPEIASFSVHADGSSDGLTVTGIPFRQYNVPNDAGIRVQRFEMQDHYHYIVDGEVVYTLSELSSRLAAAFERGAVL